MALQRGLTTLFPLFKQAGYTTGCFGEWGLGAPESVGAPNHQGVDQFFGFNCQLLAHNYYADHLWENDQRVDLLENADGKYGVYTQDLIHERGLQFVEKHRDQSFCWSQRILLFNSFEESFRKRLSMDVILAHIFEKGDIVHKKPLELLLQRWSIGWMYM